MNFNKIFTRLENKNKIRNLLDNGRYLDYHSFSRNYDNPKNNESHCAKQEIKKNIDKIKEKYGYPYFSNPLEVYQKIIGLKQKYFQENPKKQKFNIDNTIEKISLITQRNKSYLIKDNSTNLNDSTFRQTSRKSTKRGNNYRIIRETDINFPFSSKNTSSTSITSQKKNNKNKGGVSYYKSNENSKNNIYKIEKFEEKINSRNKDDLTKINDINNKNIPSTFINFVNNKKKLVQSFRFLKNTRQEYIEVDKTLKKLLKDENFNINKKKGFMSMYPISKRIKMLTNAKKDINKVNKTTRSKSNASTIRDSYNSELDKLHKELKNKNKSQSIFDAIFSDDNNENNNYSGDSECYKMCKPVLLKSVPKPRLQVPNYPDFYTIEYE